MQLKQLLFPLVVLYYPGLHAGILIYVTTTIIFYRYPGVKSCHFSFFILQALDYLGKSRGIQKTRELAQEHATRAVKAIEALPYSSSENARISRRALVDLTRRAITRTKWPFILTRINFGWADCLQFNLSLPFSAHKFLQNCGKYCHIDFRNSYFILSCISYIISRGFSLAASITMIQI